MAQQMWGVSAPTIRLPLPAIPQQGDDANALIDWAIKLYDGGQYTEAIPLAQRALAINEKALGPEHFAVATDLNTLAVLYRVQGRFAEAEPLFKRALMIREKALGPDDSYVGESLNNLAALYDLQGRYAEAEPLFKRALTVREKALGPDHPDVGETLNSLALLTEQQGRYTEAEPLLKRALSIHEKRALAIQEQMLAPSYPDVSTSLNNLAELYRAQGRYTEAIPLAQRALDIRDKALGADHPDVAQSLNNLAELLRAQGLTAEAEPLYQRALAVYEKALGPDHPNVGETLNNLAQLYFVQRDWARAADFWRRGTGVMIRRAERGAAATGQALTGKGKTGVEQHSKQFLALVKAVYRLGPADRDPDPGLAAEMFQTAQWARGSEAAGSLAQMAARGATGKPKLAAIARERQDLVGEWQGRDAGRTAAVSQPPEARNKEAEAVNVARLGEIDTLIAAIDKQLTKDFPDYAALVSPKPLSIADVQSQLQGSEALVLFLDTPEWGPEPEETFIWVVTKTLSKWVKSDIGTKALGERVAALRCGLDSSNWTDASTWPDAKEDAKRRKETQITRRERCKTLTGSEVADGEPLPFDIAKANELYQALFGQVEDLLKNQDGTFRQLLVVTSGPLTQLPFQVLVTGKPDAAKMAGYSDAAWLIRSHAITVLPSVASLKSLRQNAKTSRATNPLIGFGNPLLDGNPEKAWQVEAAHKAREKERCPEAKQQVASLLALDGGVTPLDQQKGVADLAQIRFQAPLPETADELCAVANDLGVPTDEIRLGSRATEREVKALSGSGLLANYRIVQFSTHGALAGHMRGNAEPGLILTPPETATPEDDGYLSASEIAALKLDAEWVILSACNTAAGGTQGAEALSGLARTFFYAGARALLVSHWSVYSGATVKLITKAMSTMATDTSIGRSEALRRSMVALIEQGEPQEAQPAYWAPFVVVGEGSAPLELAAAHMLQAPPSHTSSVVPIVSAPGTPPTLAPAKRKMKRKPAAGDDWITNMFGQ
jgi:CHAT domain-containing protein/Tfp pilus assembly protein PilF